LGRLEGKVALITGAARGQGEAEARLFHAEGATVVLADVLDAEAGAVAADLGDRARSVHLDVGDETAWADCVEGIKRDLGHLDVLVNNAGILHFATVRDTTLDDYMRVLKVNQVGVFLGMRAAIPMMSEQHGGSIINIASTEGMHPVPLLVAYASTKWAVRGMTRVAAMELGPLGIRVNTILPGGVDTPLVKSAGIDVDVSQWFKRLPLGRIGESGEIARLALFLASDESSYCTGADFVADGGLTAGLAIEGM
jgi:3alpha(or 20beta)-hydroxysteroid dehydrogenase